MDHTLNMFMRIWSLNDELEEGLVRPARSIIECCVICLSLMNCTEVEYISKERVCYTKVHKLVTLS